MGLSKTGEGGGLSLTLLRALQKVKKAKAKKGEMGE